MAALTPYKRRQFFYDVLKIFGEVFELNLTAKKIDFDGKKWSFCAGTYISYSLFRVKS